jgi:hypothetical protein
MPVLLDLHRGQLRAFEQALKSNRREAAALPSKSAREQAHSVRVMEGLVRTSFLVKDVIQRNWESTLDLMEVRAISDYQQTGQEVVGLIDEGLYILSEIRNQARAYVEAGHAVRRLNDLDAAIRHLETLKAEITANWPWLDANDLRAAREAEARGETLELDEAFAQIAGMSKEDWLRRVEEHKRRTGRQP